MKLRDSLLLAAALIPGALGVSSAQGDPVDYKIVDSLQNGFSMYGGTQDVLSWAPGNGSEGFLALIKRGGIEGDAIQNLNNVFIRASADLGETWDAPIGPLNDNSEAPASRYPNVTIVGNESATSTADLGYVFSFPAHDGLEDATWLGQFVGQANTGFTGQGNWFAGQSEAPFINSFQQVAGLSAEIETFDGGQVTVVGTRTITPTGAPFSESNRLVVLTFDLTNDAQPVFRSPWDPTIFADPAQENTLTVVFGGLRKDNMGNLYYGALGRLVSAEANIPAEMTFYTAPIFATSSDRGTTWSEFNQIPYTTLHQYAADNPGTDGTVWDVNECRFDWDDPSIVVTGENRASMICKAILQNSAANGGEGVVEVHIVEAEWDNGTWSLRKIAQENFVPLLITEEGGAPDTSPKGNEMEIAVTADGAHLVAKWLGFTDGETQFADVFLSSRPLSGNDWGNKRNSTNTPLFDKLSWMPSIVPAVDKVPLVSSQSILLPGEVDGTSIQQDIYRAQHIAFWTGDASPIVSVDDQEAVPSAVNFIETASPNPVVGTSTVQFELDRTTWTQIQVRDITGSTLKVLHTGQLEAGQHSFDINANELASGSYMFIVNDGNSMRFTKFVVEK